jgi:hypothetical protein
MPYSGKERNNNVPTRVRYIYKKKNHYYYYTTVLSADIFSFTPSYSKCTPRGGCRFSTRGLYKAGKQPQVLAKLTNKWPTE